MNEWEWTESKWNQELEITCGKCSMYTLFIRWLRKEKTKIVNRKDDGYVYVHEIKKKTSTLEKKGGI